MRELLHSNDTVLIGFAQSVLRQAGIASFVADQYMSAPISTVAEQQPDARETAAPRKRRLVTVGGVVVAVLRYLALIISAVALKHLPDRANDQPA